MAILFHRVAPLRVSVVLALVTCPICLSTIEPSDAYRYEPFWRSETCGRVTMSQMECYRRIDVRYERMDVKSTHNTHQRRSSSIILLTIAHPRQSTW